MILNSSCSLFLLNLIVLVFVIADDESVEYESSEDEILEEECLKFEKSSNLEGFFLY